MPDFYDSACSSLSSDPRKRVKYSLGLVLGVDEFEQDQFYSLEHDRSHNRGLHGYGTALGLHVTLDGADHVNVSSGMAVDRDGRRICVSPQQCGELAPWIVSNSEAIVDATGPLPADVPIYVLLRYRACDTDQVPLPGGPCRAAEDTMAASRIADAFEIFFSLDKPPQLEEETTVDLGDLLRRIVVTPSPPSPAVHTTPEELADLVLELRPDATPSGGTDPIYLDPPAVEQAVRQMWLVWIVQVRPALMPQGYCGGERTAPSDPEEAKVAESVLLACLQTPVESDGGTGVVLAGAPTFDPSERPLLLTTRTIQEWLISGGGFGGLTDHGLLGGLADDDHLQYLLVDGTRALTGDLSAGGNMMTDLREATANGEAVRYQQAIKVDDPAGGDLSGLYPNPSVAQIQSHPVSPSAPNAQDVLVWDGAQWAPDSAAALGLSHGDLAGLGGDDHPHYLLVDGTRALTGDLSAGTNRITDLGAATTNGDAVRYEQAIKVGDVAGDPGGVDDLGGTFPDPQVQGLQGRPVSPTAPANGNVLTWDGGVNQWIPLAPAGGGALGPAGGDLDGTYPDPTVVGLQTRPISPDAPAEYDLLKFQNGRWRPGGPFVHGAPQMRVERIGYGIVAAGWFDMQGVQRRPTYNFLRAGAIGNDEFALAFPDYFNPWNTDDVDLSYIVKGTIHRDEQPDRGFATFEFVRFTDDEIIVRVRDGGERIDGFMVEISAYGRDRFYDIYVPE